MEYQFHEKTFEQEVLGADMPVLVDFYADWCGPCKMMAPNIARLAKAYEGKIKVGKINIDQNTSVAVKYGIMSIPTVVLFKNGEEVARHIGYVDFEQLEQMVK